MPFQCNCGIILKYANKRFIEEHKNSNKHFNIMTNPNKYHYCNMCNYPIDKRNKSAIKRHKNKHKKLKSYNGVYYMVDNKSVNFDEYCQAIDELAEQKSEYS